MILQLREIFQIEGMHLPVDYTISLEELSEVRGYTFAAPVSVQGEFSEPCRYRDTEIYRFLYLRCGL
ncbi:MAG: hypothetical protein ACLSFT_11425 [Ruminococcus callidus]